MSLWLFGVAAVPSCLVQHPACLHPGRNLNPNPNLIKLTEFSVKQAQAQAQAQAWSPHTVSQQHLAEAHRTCRATINSTPPPPPHFGQSLFPSLVSPDARDLFRSRTWSPTCPVLPERVCLSPALAGEESSLSSTLDLASHCICVSGCPPWPGPSPAPHTPRKPPSQSAAVLAPSPRECPPPPPEISSLGLGAMQPRV
jgi:hypothetical protein